MADVDELDKYDFDLIISQDVLIVLRSGRLTTATLAAMRVLRTVPGVRELMTFTLYGTWRKPA